MFMRIELPEVLAQTWLQHMRNFDTAHPGCHFEVMADGPDEDMAEMIERLKIEPGLTFTKIWKRGEP